MFFYYVLYKYALKLVSPKYKTVFSKLFISPLLSAKLDIVTDVIAENLGKNWRKLGRKLGLNDVKLESIGRKYPTDLEETAVELLKAWRKSRGAEARAKELIEALRECQYNMTAENVQDKLAAQGY